MRKLRCILLLGILAVSVLVLTGLMTLASATLEIVETSTKTIGKTTIRWNSSFQDLDYTLGDNITMTVTWEVMYGAADYVRFEPRRPYFTPRSKKDPADGTVYMDSITRRDNTVTVKFEFTDLHLDRERNVEIGNAKFKLYLQIDRDGDGVLDVVVGYGVNVHVEDPQ